MSSISFRRPEFRLHLGYPDIILTSGSRTLGRVAAEAGGFRAALARLTEPVRAARGRLVAVLPESEVWRGRLDLAGRTRAERRASARVSAAGRLAAAPGELAIVIGPRDPGGSYPVAGVRRSTLVETRALLAAIGLRPAAIVGAGLFTGFAAAPRLGGWPLPLPALPPHRQGLAAATAAGAVTALALLALGLPGPDAPAPAAPLAPAQAEAALLAVELPPVAEVVLPAPPPSLALAAAAPPRPRPAGTLGAPMVTVAARNMPANLPAAVEKPKPGPVQRLSGLAAAPARALDSITAPLRRPAAPAPEPAPKETAATQPPPPAAADLRPMRRPKAEAPAPAATPERAALAPRPRAGSPEPAVLVASLEPAPLMQASIAAAAAAAVASVAEPPPARPAPKPLPKKAAAKPAPAKPAPVVVVRPKPPAVAAPVRQKAAAKPVPVKPVPVKTVRVKTVPPKIVAAKPVPVRQAAKQVRRAAPQQVAALAPVAAKPQKARPAAQRVGLSRGKVSLVGVFAGADGRSALVRLPNGDIEKVKAGDRVQGVQVAAISADSVRLTGRGKDTLLRLPD